MKQELNLLPGRSETGANHQTAVVFRTFHSGDVIALFPFQPSDNYGFNCMSYQHIGQHGGACVDLCAVGTRPSTADEVASLKPELERIGYNLRVLKRIPRNALEIRKAVSLNPSR